MVLLFLTEATSGKETICEIPGKIAAARRLAPNVVDAQPEAGDAESVERVYFGTCKRLTKDRHWGESAHVHEQGLVEVVLYVFFGTLGARGVMLRGMMWEGKGKIVIIGLTPHNNSRLRL